MIVDAGGSTANGVTSVYLVYNDKQGVHFIYGNNTGLTMGDWTKQQVRDVNNKALFAYVNSLTGPVFGLSINNPSKVIVRINKY